MKYMKYTTRTSTGTGKWPAARPYHVALAGPAAAAPADGGHGSPPAGYMTRPCPTRTHDPSAFRPFHARQLARGYVVQHYQQGQGSARATATEIDTERDAAGQHVCVFDIRVQGSAAGAYSVHVTRTRKPKMAVWWARPCLADHGGSRSQILIEATFTVPW
jgi:hypothetical protein